MAGGFANDRLYGAALQYQRGGLTVGASYPKMNRARSADAAGAVTGDNTFDASSQRNVGIGATYAFSKALIGFAYSHVGVYDPTSNAYFTGTTRPAGGHWQSWKFDHFEINGRYRVTPAFYAGAAYVYAGARRFDGRRIPSEVAPTEHEARLRSVEALVGVRRRRLPARAARDERAHGHRFRPCVHPGRGEYRVGTEPVRRAARAAAPVLTGRRRRHGVAPARGVVRAYRSHAAAPSRVRGAGAACRASDLHGRFVKGMYDTLLCHPSTDPSSTP